MIYPRENYSELPPRQRTLVRRMVVMLWGLRPVDFWMEEGAIEDAHDEWASALYKEAALYRRMRGMFVYVIFPSSCKGVKPLRRDSEDPDDPAPRDLAEAFNTVV